MWPDEFPLYDLFHEPSSPKDAIDLGLHWDTDLQMWDTTLSIQSWLMCDCNEDVTSKM